MDLPITVRPGTILVEGISGVVEADHFILYVTTREKHTFSECVCENPAVVVIGAQKTLLRVIETPEGEDFEQVDLSKEVPTVIYLPDGWSVESSVSGYTCRIIGVRTPEAEAIQREIPYRVEEAT